MGAITLGMACILAGIWSVIIWEAVGMEVAGLAAILIGGVLIMLGREGAE